MIISFCELREKDVVNLCDGRRLGCVVDVSVDTDCGKICAIFVSDKFFTLSGGRGCIRVPFDKINCIGEDAILVSVKDSCSSECKNEDKKPRRGKFFGGFGL